MVVWRRGPERAHSSMRERGPQKPGHQMGCMGAEGPSSFGNAHLGSAYTALSTGFVVPDGLADVGQKGPPGGGAVGQDGEHVGALRARRHQRRVVEVAVDEA